MPCRYLSIVLAVRALIFFFHLAYLSCDVDLWPQDNNHLANETLTKTRTKTKAQLQLHSMQGMQGVKEVGGGLTRCATSIVGQRRRCSRLERSAAGREAFPVGCGWERGARKALNSLLIEIYRGGGGHEYINTYIDMYGHVSRFANVHAICINVKFIFCTHSCYY